MSVQSLSAGFVGLGLEAWTLSLRQFARTNLAAYLRALGPARILMIGGNSLDDSFWTSTGEQPPSWSMGTITPESLWDLARVLAGTGWRVILGVNLKHNDPARAADEATYARRILGAALEAVAIGNEPEAYYASEPEYFAAFERYVRAIRSAVPGVGIAGPDAATGDFAWEQAFARDDVGRPEITVLTDHYYPLSACSAQQPTIADLLSAASARGEVAAANAAVTAGRTAHVPAVIDETNSAVCWGTPGMSDTYASALWSLDYALRLAQAGVASVDFHGRIAGCNPYSPLCTAPERTQLTAQPEFYGLLAVRQVGSGRFLSVAASDPAGVPTYAVQTGPGRMSVVLDNFGPATTVAVHISHGHYRHAWQTVLATSSPRGLSAVSGITLGGRRITTDGILPEPLYARVKLSGSRVIMNLRGYSAVILKLA
jgi:hypothetical protein